MDGYAAYRKAQAAQQASQPSCCQQCQQPLPVQTGRGAKRLYCNASCKNAAFEANRQPRPKRTRTDYHRNYQRMRRAEQAQNVKEAK